MNWRWARGLPWLCFLFFLAFFLKCSTFGNIGSNDIQERALLRDDATAELFEAIQHNNEHMSGPSGEEIQASIDVYLQKLHAGNLTTIWPDTKFGTSKPPKDDQQPSPNPLPVPSPPRSPPPRSPPPRSEDNHPHVPSKEDEAHFQPQTPSPSPSAGAKDSPHNALGVVAVVVHKVYQHIVKILIDYAITLFCHISVENAAIAVMLLTALAASARAMKNDLRNCLVVSNGCRDCSFYPAGKLMVSAGQTVFLLSVASFLSRAQWIGLPSSSWPVAHPFQSSLFNHPSASQPSSAAVDEVSERECSCPNSDPSDVLTIIVPCIIAPFRRKGPHGLRACQ